MLANTDASMYFPFSLTNPKHSIASLEVSPGVVTASFPAVNEVVALANSPKASFCAVAASSPVLTNVTFTSAPIFSTVTSNPVKVALSIAVAKVS